MTNLNTLSPEIKISVKQIFGIDTEMKVDGFSKKNEYVPEIDGNYKFDRDTTLAILSGFAFNKLSHRNLSEKDKDAFIVMGLNLNADWNSIQKKFKTLVKKFHPDRNSGNKQFEDKLKKITLAYSHLKMIMIKK